MRLTISKRNHIPSRGRYGCYFECKPGFVAPIRKGYCDSRCATTRLIPDPCRIDDTNRNGANEILICSIRASYHSSGPDLIILPICLHIGPSAKTRIRRYVIIGDCSRWCAAVTLIASRGESSRSLENLIENLRYNDFSYLFFLYFFFNE